MLSVTDINMSFMICGICSTVRIQEKMLAVAIRNIMIEEDSADSFSTAKMRLGVSSW